VTVSVGIADHADALTAKDQATRALSAWSVASETGDTVSIYRPLDRLTGLVVGRGILDALEDAIDLALSGSRSVSVIQIDVDGFGEANATLGYPACDQFLTKLSAALNEQFGSDGIVGRLWSDEFLIVLTDVRAEDAAFRAEDVRRKIAGSESDPGPTSLSVGVATFPRHASNAHELMRKVREARYQSREQGGGCICVAEADQMVTKTSHFSKIQLKRLTALAKSQDRSEASVLREGLDMLLAIYEDGASNGLSAMFRDFE
jgi:diguanylate cyclase (GGDEF)-like protein